MTPPYPHLKGAHQPSRHEPARARTARGSGYEHLMWHARAAFRTPAWLSLFTTERRDDPMTTNDPPGVAESLTLVARELNAPRDLQSTLQTIVDSAQRSMPGIDHVGISISHSNGRIETRAATGELVWKLDSLQYDLREGPCVHSIEADA